MDQLILRYLPGLVATLSAMLGAATLLPRNRTKRHLFFGLINLGTYCWSLSYFIGAGGLRIPETSLIAGAGTMSFILGQFGVALAVTSWLAFSLETVGLERWTSGGRLAVVYLPGVLLMGGLLTNGVHGQFVRWSAEAGSVAFAYGPLGNGLNMLAYGLVLVAIVIYLRAAREAALPVRRRLLRLLALAGAIPLFGNIVWMTRGMTGISLSYNPTVVLFALMNALLGIGIFRVGLLDIVPTAEGHAFQSMTDAGLVLSTDGRIAAINAAATNMLPSAAIGRVLSDAAPGLSVHLEVHAGTDPVRDTFEIVMGDRTYRVRDTPMTGRTGHPLGRLVMLSDQTEQLASDRRIRALNRSLERSVMELQQATQSKDRFIANMSHELRTPLQSILGFTGALDRGISGTLNETQSEQVSIILDSARHLVALIDSLLDLSRIESGVLVASPRRFDLNDASKRAFDALSGIAARKGLSFEFVPAEMSHPIVSTDETKLRQILVNLLGNAIKFTGEGSVRLEVTYGDDQFGFRVIDTGPGIDGDDVVAIFDPFSQGGPAHSAARSSGIGLGLYVSRCLARLLGGDITLESTSGAGTVFSVSLPAQLPAQDSTEAL